MRVASVISSCLLHYGIKSLAAEVIYTKMRNKTITSSQHAADLNSPWKNSLMGYGFGLLPSVVIPLALARSSIRLANRKRNLSRYTHFAFSVQFSACPCDDGTIMIMITITSAQHRTKYRACIWQQQRLLFSVRSCTQVQNFWPPTERAPPTAKLAKPNYEKNEEQRI